MLRSRRNIFQTAYPDITSPALFSRHLTIFRLRNRAARSESRFKMNPLMNQLSRSVEQGVTPAASANSSPLGPFVVNLRQLFPSASFVGCGDLRVTSAVADSRECRPGVLFAALRGPNFDGHDHLQQAVENGARFLLVERPQPDLRANQCVVRNTRKAYAELCEALVGFPSRRVGIVGVTGTNGKTTTCWLIRSILSTAGRPAGLLGTVEYHDGLERFPSSLTTPSPEELSRWLARMVRNKTFHAAMEVSSHALVQERVAGVRFDVAVITNITQDHFDYHGSYASYKSAKQQIFSRLKPEGLAILNADDPGSLSCRIHAPQSVRTYGIESPADYVAEILDESLNGTRFRLRYNGEEIDVFTSLVGRHNVSNALAAVAAVSSQGISLEQAAWGIESLRYVPGRLQRIDVGQPTAVFVDYAHTDDALLRVIGTLQQLTVGRVICVFGAGGDRDKSKRPLMGKAASRADLAIITSDNPRSEDPAAIVEDILLGVSPHAPRPVIELDREQAIIAALDEARPDDCVVIAGKGHESSQILADRSISFDDCEVARRHLIRRRLAEHSFLSLQDIPGNYNPG